MDVWEAQVRLIVWMQENIPQLLNPVLVYSSLLGSKYIIYSSLVLFWASNVSAFGLKMSRALAISGTLMGILKMLIAAPRPVWIDERVAHLDPTKESSFSFPSGHVTVVTVVMFQIIAALPLLFQGRKKLHVSLKYILVALFVTVCVSRVYTGSHFVHDVLGGIITGFAVALAERLVTSSSNDDRYLHEIHTPLWTKSLIVIGLMGFAATLFHAQFSGLKKAYEALQGAGFAWGLLIVRYLPAPFDLASVVGALRLPSKGYRAKWSFNLLVTLVLCIIFTVAVNTSISMTDENMDEIAVLLEDLPLRAAILVMIPITVRLVVSWALIIFAYSLAPVFLLIPSIGPKTKTQ